MTTREHFQNDYRQEITRRWFFKQCGVGLGAVALRSLLGGKNSTAADPGFRRKSKSLAR